MPTTPEEQLKSEPTVEQTIVPNVQNTGTWYEFFSGSELSVTDVNASMLLKAGEYRLYSDKKLPAFEDLATNTLEKKTNSTLRVYPNPVTDYLNIELEETVLLFGLYSVDGRILQKSNPNAGRFVIRTENLRPGVYFIRLQTARQLFTEKIIKN